ncbi:unnamed protein product [Mytilus edulis]|uniref:Macro domain-containing protein n=1 Tax=Mytilus edulis TaxID=6550 RepID=A0A8S3SA86_MYTED|nr:unnamed protein product [Mytilus edulis]
MCSLFLLDGTWIETTNVSPECITCKISVVGENSRIVDATFKEVIENISQRKRENITFSSCQSVESHDIPLDQTIDRRANISSTEQTDNSNPQVQDKDSNGQVSASNNVLCRSFRKKKIPTDSIHMSHNTFAPDDDLPRFTDKTESEECTVEIMMIQDDVEDPCKEILDMMNRSNIKVEKIVWNELNCKQARVKLSSETEISTARDLLLRWKEEGSSQTGTENQITKPSKPPLALENLGDMEGDPLNISNVRRSNDKNQVAAKTEIKDKVPDKEKNISKSDFKRPLNRNGDYTDEKDSNERSLHNQSLNNANLDGKTRNPDVDNPSSNAPGSQPSGETAGAIPKQKQIENSGGGDKYEFPSFAAGKQHTDEDFQRPNTGKLESVEKNNRNNGKVTNKDPWEKKVMVPLAIPQEESLMLITKEGIKVFVYKAHICHIANVDCIVNSTSSDMTHKHGLSFVIAKEAGKRMEEECKRFISTFAALGRSDVCVTTAGNLSPLQENFAH